MKISTLCALLTLATNSPAVETRLIREQLALGRDANRVFVSTNSASMPFYLIATNLNFAAMVGEKRNTNIISESRMALTAQHVPTLERVQGRIAPSGYSRVSGRYAVLVGQVLTLTDFQMDLSVNQMTRGEVLAVHSESVSFQVSVTFAEEAKTLVLGAAQPKR